MALVTFTDLTAELGKIGAFNSRFNALKAAVNGLLDRLNIKTRFIVQTIVVNVPMAAGEASGDAFIVIPNDVYFSANAKITKFGLFANVKNLDSGAGDSFDVTVNILKRSDDSQVGPSVGTYSLESKKGRVDVDLAPTALNCSANYIQINGTLTSSGTFDATDYCQVTICVATELVAESEL